MQYNNKNKKIVNILRPGLYADDPLAMVTLPQRSLSSQSLGKYWNLTKTLEVGCLVLQMYAVDSQTDVRQHHHLMPFPTRAEE